MLNFFCFWNFKKLLSFLIFKMQNGNFCVWLKAEFSAAISPVFSVMIDLYYLYNYHLFIIYHKYHEFFYHFFIIYLPELCPLAWQTLWAVDLILGNAGLNLFYFISCSHFHLFLASVIFILAIYFVNKKCYRISQNKSDFRSQWNILLWFQINSQIRLLTNTDNSSYNYIS